MKVATDVELHSNTAENSFHLQKLLSQKETVFVLNSGSPCLNDNAVSVIWALKMNN